MKYILAILLMLLALTTTASSLDALLRDLPNPDLTFDVQLPQAPQINDFSNRSYTTNTRIRPVNLADDPDGFVMPYASWYKQDFANDPFDGLVEIMVIGEPLPSSRATLIIVFIIGGIIYCTRKQPVVV